MRIRIGRAKGLRGQEALESVLARHESNYNRYWSGFCIGSLVVTVGVG